MAEREWKGDEADVNTNNSSLLSGLVDGNTHCFPIYEMNLDLGLFVSFYQVFCVILKWQMSVC